MLWNDIAHPSFDARAPRRAIVVTTGRLTGGAPADAQQFAGSLKRRRRRSLRERFSRTPTQPFEVWDRDKVLELIRENVHLALDGWTEAALREFLGLLADCDRAVVSQRHVEKATRAWTEDLSRAMLATALIAQRLNEARRSDLAAVASLSLARGAALSANVALGTSAFTVSRELFKTYGEALVSTVAPCVEDPTLFLGLCNELLPVATYPIRCSIVLEVAGLLGLLYFDEGANEKGQEMASLLAKFVAAQPGASHPVSDRWAISLVPCAALLRRCDAPELTPWLERTVAWTCDRYEDGAGLASVYAEPDEEIVHLLGFPYEHLEVKSRRSSFLATFILDLACTLELPQLFRDALNDFEAVEIVRPVLEPADEPSSLGHEGGGLLFEANVDYDEHHDFESSWRAGVHHKRCPPTYALQHAGRCWELLAISTLLRDRLFLLAIRESAGLTVGDA
jgi:hypothetical protein